MKEQSDIELLVNGKKAIEELANVKKEVDELTASWRKAADAGDKAIADQLHKDLEKSKRHLHQVESGVKAVERTFAQLNKATPADLQKSLRFLQSELKNVERGSAAWKFHTEKIRILKAELDKVNSELKQSESLFERMKNTVNNWGASIAAGIGALTGIVAAGKKAVTMYAEMQQEEANVRKYTGMTAEEVQHLNDEFKKMDTRTSREALNQLAQEAGRLGKQSEEDVLGFVRAADKINVALDDLGDGATLTLSKLTNIFGDEQRLGTEKALLSVGSVINELSQNCTASAPYLAEFAQRLAGVGAQAGMSIPEIMGFGAVLDSQGQKVEMSATALSQVIMKLFKDPAKIATATGMAVEEFSETCKRSTNEGLLMLLNRLHEIGGIDSLAPVFADMGENGARASAVLAALAGNIDTVRAQQEAANVAFQEATSIDKEFEVQNTTVQAGLEKARKNFTELAVTLGQELMPIVSHIISGTSATMKIMLKTIQFVKDHTGAIITLSAAIASYTVAANLAMMKEKAHAALVAIKTAALHAHKVAVLLASAAYGNMTNNTIKANAAMKLLNRTMKASPWGLLFGAIAAVVGGLGAFIKKRNEAGLLEKTMASAQKEINRQYTEQRAKIDMLKDAVHDESLSLGERKKALEELKSIVPDYHASLTDEGKLINDNADAIENYTKKLEKQIQLQVYQEKLTELYRKKMQAEQNVTDRQSDLDKANQEASEHSGEVQMRTSMGAAGPTGGFENSYSVNVRVKTENLEGAKKELEDITGAIDVIREKMKAGDLLEPPTAGGNTTPSSEGSPLPSAEPDSKQQKKELDAKLKAIEDWKKKEQAIEDIAYALGQKTYSDHVAKNLEIEKQYHEKKLELYEEGSTEYYQEQAAFEKKMRTENNANSLKEQQTFYDDEKRCLDDRYMKNEITYKQYTRALEEAELDHLYQVTQIYNKGSKEYLDAQEKLRSREHDIQKKRFEEYKEIQDNLKKAYFSTTSRASDKEAYEEEMMQLEAVKSQLLLMADSEQKKLEIYRAYREARFQIAKKYNMDAAMDAENSFRASMEKIAAWLESDYGQAFTKSFSTLVDGMGQIFSGLSSLIDAETDLQTAKIEKKYDAEIKAAGKNKKAVARLEEEKEKEIAAVKNEAEEKKYAMQVASAVAQTAISAINAFSSASAIPVVGWVMAPIAAAMAVAAGAIQIATLKKERDAALAKGYAAGGYTMPGKKYQPAGIVHAGEWVASQELLANPTAAATIAQLDQAQRTNTIGQLSKPAPSIAIAKDEPSVARSNGLQYSEGENASVGASIDRLNKTLDGGIYAGVLMTGDTGLVRQQEKYNQLMRNKSKK